MSADFAHSQAHPSRSSRSRNPFWGALLGIAAAVPACLWLWGFTVDDALITARVAAHYAQGLGPRFNAQGPITDAVTPLGYERVLALFGDGDVLHTFRVAKWLGLLAWLTAASVLGALIARAGQRVQRFTPLGLVALNAPLAAWAVSGMETGLVTLLTTLGLCDGALAALALGVAAAWRPELAPFCVILVGGRTLATRSGAAGVTVRFALLGAPVVFVALLRLASFGRAVPLSFYAKPSDFAHGLRYALGAFAFTGLPWLLLATPRQVSGLPRSVRPLFAALFGHFAALVLCGGDWMAMYRLAVPVLPCVAVAAAHLAEQARPGRTAVRFSFGLAGSLILALGLGARARRVGEDRAQLISDARAVFAHDARIAALDVGWLGAASDAQLIDLAGVTDPEVAFFPGGHTSKRIPGAWLFSHQPTAIVLFLADQDLNDPFEGSWFSRPVEARIAHLVASEYRVRTTLRLGAQSYVVLEPR
ncbi:MAG: hypothetical protein ABW061_11445 [Polyangiaceae bacterium]